MPRYLIIGSYTAQGEEGLLAKGGTARRASVSEMVEKLGGRVETFDYAFGEDDVFVVCELPDNVTAAAIGLAVGASGRASRPMQRFWISVRFARPRPGARASACTWA